MFPHEVELTLEVAAFRGHHHHGVLFGLDDAELSERAVIANAGGKLGGSGTAGAVGVNTTVNAGGYLTPGATDASTGTLTLLGNLVLAENSIYNWEFGASAGDKVHVNGNVTLPAHVTVNIASVAPGYPSPAVLLEWDGTNLGATSLVGWTVESGFNVTYDGVGRRVLLSAPSVGTVFIVR